MWLRYLNATTLVSGRPYAWTTTSVPARDFSADILRLFLSATLAHWSVFIWRSIRVSRGTKMAHWGQYRWGRFLSYKMMMVSHMWKCKKWTPSPVQFAENPWHPSTGHTIGPYAHNNDNRYLWSSSRWGGGGVLPLGVHTCPMLCLSVQHQQYYH